MFWNNFSAVFLIRCRQKGLLKSWALVFQEIPANRRDEGCESDSACQTLGDGGQGHDIG